MATVDPAQIFGYLVQKHGVAPATAAGILVNIQYESSFRTDAIGDNGTSGGLFQHHLGRWDNLKAYASRTGRSWDDWTAQVDFAMQEARSMGINLQNADPAAAAKEWTIRFERPANMHTKAAQRAADVGRYTSLDPTIDYTAPPRGGDGSAMPEQNQEAVYVPTDGTWYQHPDGGYAVAYAVQVDQPGGSSAKAVVWYRTTTPPPSGKSAGSSKWFAEHSAAWIDGGTTDSFRGVPKGTTYAELVDETLFKLGLAGSDATLDAGVMAVVGLAMTRELSPTELANRLRNTNWYQSRTDKEREWDDLSDAEKDQRIQDAMSQLASSWFTYVGEDLGVAAYDRNGDGIVSADELRQSNPDLYTWSERVASGKASVVTAVNTWMKDVAGENPESPWSRTVREEEQAQGQFGVDVDNATAEIRELYRDWGHALSEEKARIYGQQLVMNEKSIDDFVQALDKSAMARMPGKPAGMSVREFAEPYIQTYQSLLEAPEPDLRDPLISKGLFRGLSMAEFEDLVRQDDRWLETDNARAEMHGQIGQLGRIMGF